MGKGSLFDADLLINSYIPKVYAYYFKQWEDFRMAYHRHDSTEIMYVIQGHCVVEWNEGGEGASSVRLEKGQLILLDANVPHRLVVEQTCRMLNVEFGFVPHSDAFPSIKQFAEEEESLRGMLLARTSYLVLQAPEEVYHALKSLVLELDEQGGDGGVLNRMLLMQLMIRLGRLRSEQERSQAPSAGAYVKSSIAYLLQNYDRPLTVKKIASNVSLHPGYLQRIFKLQTGHTLMEYLTEIRMDKAKMLLAHTDIPVADISEYVGAGSRQYFHAMFKKNVHIILFNQIEFETSPSHSLFNNAY